MIRCILSLAMYILLCGAAMAATEVRVFTLVHQSAEELEPVVAQTLGDDGKVTAFRNQLIVRGSAADLKAVATLLRELDQRRESLTISVRQQNSSVSTGTHLGVAAEGRVGDADYEAGRVTRGTSRPATGGAVELQAQRTLGNAQSSVEQFLHVLDGDRAFIVVGKKVPFTSDLAVASGKHNAYARSVRYLEVNTGFWVKPTIRGEEVEMEISPRLADATAADPPVIEFQELTTRVRVPVGSWFDLGATMSTGDEVSGAILSHTLQTGSEHRQILIKVDR